MISIITKDISNKYTKFRDIFSELFEKNDKYIEYINLIIISKKLSDNNSEITFKYDWYDKHNNNKIRKFNFISFNYYYNQEQKRFFTYNCSYFPINLYKIKHKIELINLLNDF